MPLIDTSYFFGDLNIGQKSEVAGSLSEFILEYEDRLLNDLFGYAFKKVYDTGIGASTEKYVAIRDGKEYTNRSGQLAKWRGLKYTIGTVKKSPIANYVYWHWMQNEASSTTGTGEVKLNAQNATSVSPAGKMVRAWNEMVQMVYELIEFLLSNENDYPEFIDWYVYIPASLLRKQNLFGI